MAGTEGHDIESVLSEARERSNWARSFSKTPWAALKAARSVSMTFAADAALASTSAAATSRFLIASSRLASCAS